MFTIRSLIFLVLCFSTFVYGQVLTSSPSIQISHTTTLSDIYKLQSDTVNVPPFFPQAEYKNYTAPAPSEFASKYPNFGTVMAFLGGIGYGTADLISDPPIRKLFGSFTRMAGFVSATSRLGNFLGPIASMVMNLLFPSPSTQDVIDQISEKIDNSTWTILKQMQQSFVILASYINEQSLDIKKSIYEINQYAAFRAILDDIAILENLNAKVAANVDHEVWSYEIFPCGTAMTLCNNAYAQLAYSLEDLLAAVSLYSESKQEASLPEVYKYGDYILTLLSQATISLVKVNKMYVEVNMPDYDIFDLKVHIAMTNSERLQANYLKAFDIYKKFLFSSNSSVTWLVPFRTAFPVDQVMRGLEFFKTDYVSGAAYGKNTWTSVVFPQQYNQNFVFDNSSTVFNSSFYAYKIAVCSKKIGKESCELQYSTWATRSDMSSIKASCPLGTFVQQASKRMVGCVQLVDTVSSEYNNTYDVTYESSNETSGGNCTRGGYYMIGYNRIQIKNWQVCIDYYNSKNKDYYDIYLSPCLKNQNYITTLYCAKPQYLTEYKQCSIIRQQSTQNTFLVLNRELLNIDSFLSSSSLFVSDPKISYVNSLPYIEGPVLDFTSRIQIVNKQFYLVNRAGKYMIKNMATFEACQFNLIFATVNTDMTAFSHLPFGSTIDISNEDFPLRITEAQLTQDNIIANQWANYTISFVNQNPLPRTVAFTLLMSTSVHVSNCYLKGRTFMKPLKCQFDNSTFILKMSSQLENYIPSNTSLQVTFGMVKNPQPASNNPLALYIYSDSTFNGFLEGTLRNIQPQLACDSSCDTCSITNKSHCLTCIDSLLYLSEGSCVSNCPFYQYTNKTDKLLYCFKECPFRTYTTSKFCINCNSKCLSCNNPITCASCDKNGILPFYHQGSCLSSCPKGTTNVQGICKLCHPSCAACAYDQSNCTQCALNYEMVNHSCTLTCSEGYYPLNNTCFKCYETCSSCKGPLQSDCLGCDVNSTQPYFFEGKCLSECPSTYFGKNGECIYCDDSCKTCSTSEGQICTSCFTDPEPQYLYQSACISSCLQYSYWNQRLNSWICYDQCPEGTFQLEQSCFDCNEGCANCTKIGQCSICSSNYELNVNGLCDRCGVGCASCTNGMCNVCSPGYIKFKPVRDCISMALGY